MEKSIGSIDLCWRGIDRFIWSLWLYKSQLINCKIRCLLLWQQCYKIYIRLFKRAKTKNQSKQFIQFLERYTIWSSPRVYSGTTTVQYLHKLYSLLHKGNKNCELLGWQHHIHLRKECCIFIKNIGGRNFNSVKLVSNQWNEVKRWQMQTNCSK